MACVMDPGLASLWLKRQGAILEDISIDFSAELFCTFKHLQCVYSLSTLHGGGLETALSQRALQTSELFCCK